jgi:hypothetical protein
MTVFVWSFVSLDIVSVPGVPPHRGGETIYCRPVNVFILSAGRSGSQTFARASAHITNYTSEHESQPDAVPGAMHVFGSKLCRIGRKLPVFLRNA